jgi:hypothetical protein
MLTATSAHSAAAVWGGKQSGCTCGHQVAHMSGTLLAAQCHRGGSFRPQPEGQQITRYSEGVTKWTAPTGRGGVGAPASQTTNKHMFCVILARCLRFFAPCLHIGCSLRLMLALCTALERDTFAQSVYDTRLPDVGPCTGTGSRGSAEVAVGRGAAEHLV